tara:strand:+ start:7977 stop:9011 length:1035 start_codon:yes stop_codon:yes gene_type:complete
VFELLIFFIIIFLSFNFLNIICLNKNVLVDIQKNSDHKKLTNKLKVPITGGILIVFSIIFILDEITLLNKFIFLLIFFLGLLSDINKLTSPRIRFLIQLIIVIIYIFLNETYISQIRINFFDNYLFQIILFKIIFTSFCLLILINGSNFIDGVNTLNSGYYLILFCNILFFVSNHSIILESQNIKILSVVLLVFLIFNIFSKSFLGDSGSYVLSFFSGVFLIELFNENSFISPYYIAILLWYPAFENFFTLTRRLIFEKSKIKVADNLHLHHLIFLFFKKKNINVKILNTLTGLTINLFNILIFISANKFIYETKKLILILLISIILYLASYFLLKRNLKEIKK